MNTPIPAPGLGTYRQTEHDVCVESVSTALEVGYRHVDTAEAYGNEAAVSDGIAAAEVDDSEVFLATKVLHRDSPTTTLRQGSRTTSARVWIGWTSSRSSSSTGSTGRPANTIRR